jgi:riboflavin transporter FmnP
MNTKAIAIVIAFAALALVLNPAVSGVGIPFPPIQGLIFNLWEIIIITAFLLTGFKGGLSVALLNAVFLFAIYPGPSRAIYPLTNTVAVSSMMVGIYFANKFITRKSTGEKLPSSGKTVTYYTSFSMLLRIVVMAPIMYGLQRLVGMPETVIFTVILPLQALFNIVIALYTISIGYFIAKIVNKNLKFDSTFV